jgi:allantoate deiminase
MVTPSGLRAVARCDELGLLTDVEGQIFRPYLGPAHQRALTLVAGFMQEAGMSTRVDAAGNLVGRYKGAAPGSKALLIGSHIDSVRDAGRYDGTLGVMLAIEVVAALSAAGRRLPFAVEILAFGDEEGSRLPASMLCSRAVAGLLRAEDLEIAGLDQILAEAGLSKAALLAARREPGEVIGYFEAHIEQGPVLEVEGLALGVVTAIAAQKRFEVFFSGVAGHAGTNVMTLRRDALAAAAEAILAIERVGRAGPPDLVATVGQMTVLPGAANVVPGSVRFTLDVRAGEAAARDRAVDAILEALAQISARRGVGFSQRLIHDLPASPCDPRWIEWLGQAVEAVGQPRRPIVSGAGHDAMAMAALGPMVMLFIRCAGGVSHNPLESVDPDDADLALKAMLAFLNMLETLYDV